VAQLCDLFVLLLAPAGGDELQGVKRGIMEMADLILVNKADVDLRATAIRTVADYAGALRLLRKRPQDPGGFPKAMTVSAIEEEGLDEAWAEMQALSTWRRDEGWWDRTRAAQAVHWFEAELRERLLSRLRHPDIQTAIAAAADAVATGAQSPDVAAGTVLSRLSASDAGKE
ncbi:MAG: methylmalonyl Co-A mutase-associated GTPase MeaB, partial [Pseudomonadota bacterium]